MSAARDPAAGRTPAAAPAGSPQPSTARPARRDPVGHVIVLVSYLLMAGTAPLAQLQADGLIRRTGSVVEVVDEARPLVRTVAAAFDAHLPHSTAPHVVAV